MGKLFNNFLVNALPLVPKFIVRQIANRYVAGDSVEDAIQTTKELNRKGFLVTLDILGEHVKDLSETEFPTNQYVQLYHIIKENRLEANISLKLSQLGLELDEKACWDNLQKILSTAKEAGNFLRIDMEDSSLTTKTLSIFQKAKEKYSAVGTVIQAYLFRSEKDIQELLPLGINIRVCKGIYKEPPEIAYQDKEEIRANFIRLVKLLLENGAYAAIATHDLYLIHSLEEYIRENKIPKDRYEFQALLGVPIVDTLTRLIREGHRVRIYVPFGTEWYAYSTRRLKENPNIAGYVVKNIFSLNS